MSRYLPIPNIDPRTLEWGADGTLERPYSRLLAGLEIGNLQMHLHAYEVTTTEDDQVAVDPEFQPFLDHLQEEYGGAFHMTTIFGRAYVVTAVPFVFA